MRTRLLAVVILLVTSTRTPAADEPPLPPIVFQAQPVGQVFDNFRLAADFVGGEKGVKAVNKRLKEVFGEKGLEGVDINRPVVGYVILAPKPQDITAVVAFPVTTEKEFLALCDRVNLDPLRVDPKDKTLYHLPPLDPRYKAMLRFSDQYAYIAYGFNPAPHIEAKSLVPMPKLYDPTDRGLISGRLYFDRIPTNVKLAAGTLMEEVKITVPGAFGLGRQESAWLTKAVMPEIEKLLLRYLLLSSGADTLTARVYIDPQLGNLVAEASLTAKPESELSKMIAAYKVAPNRFASLTNHPDTVGAFHTRAPLFAPEIRAAVKAALDAGVKEAERDAPAMIRSAWIEVFKGFGRTVKEGELDVAVALRGADKDGWYHVIGAIAFDDGTALEKEVKAVVAKSLPKEEQDHFTWDADKVGKVGIHTCKIPQGGFFDYTKFLGGEKCTAAFAFGPHGLIGVIGPDPVAVVKEVLAAKPIDAPSLEFVANPGRVVKVFEKAAGANAREAIEMATLLGKEDKKVPVMSLVFEGGKELKGTFTMNLRLLPKLMFSKDIDRANREPIQNPEPAPPKPVKRN